MSSLPSALSSAMMPSQTSSSKGSSSTWAWSGLCSRWTALVKGVGLMPMRRSMSIRPAVTRCESLTLRPFDRLRAGSCSGQALGSSSGARQMFVRTVMRVRPLLVISRICCWIVDWSGEWLVDSGECVGGVSAVGAGPRDWCRALSSWVTSLGDSGLLWGTDGGDSRIAPRIEYGAGCYVVVVGVGGWVGGWVGGDRVTAWGICLVLCRVGFWTR